MSFVNLLPTVKSILVYGVFYGTVHFHGESSCPFFHLLLNTSIISLNICGRQLNSTKEDKGQRGELEAGRPYS